ncbi:MAG: hypothetical protein OI74_02320 [Gammaproteobacteria bacterium (ex Lamellibrachia satsuma)]|nr:MAG: hypothetical protein NV67_14615 [Gammaproteobacteria bacterium (ex Lamellibrachia satsuma)]RRS35585.1 MAG: hypothetical protein OI74_02320 [Gammaproteobacteria bacterium (ex Lamellibrachia satsuma)]
MYNELAYVFYSSQARDQMGQKRASLVHCPMAGRSGLPCPQGWYFADGINCIRLSLLYTVLNVKPARTAGPGVNGTTEEAPWKATKDYLHIVKQYPARGA